MKSGTASTVRRRRRVWEDVVVVALGVFVALVLYVLFSATAAHAAQLEFKGEVAGVHASSVRMSSDGRFLYAAAPNVPALLLYEWGAGTLTEKARYTLDVDADGVSDPKPESPRQVVLSPDEKRVYTIWSRHPNSSAQADAVVVYDRNAATGQLTLREKHQNGAAGVTGLATPSAVAVTPDGKHLYVTGSESNSIAAFAVTNGGGLSFLKAYTATAGDGLSSPLTLWVTSDGKHVYAGGDVDNAIAAFAHDAVTGALSPLESFAVAGAPWRLTGSSDGAFLYAVLGDPPAIAVLARDVRTGKLSSIDTISDGDPDPMVTALGDVAHLTLSPAGTALYAARFVDGAVSVFRRHPLTGALSIVDAMTDAANPGHGLQGVQHVATTPQGDTVFTAGTAEIGIYSAISTDLKATNMTGHGFAIVGNTLALRFTVTNESANTAPGAALTLAIPQDMQLSALSATQGACIATAAIATCELGVLGKGETATVTLTGAFQRAGQFHLQPTVFSNLHDATPTDNNIDATINVQLSNNAPLAVNDAVIAQKDTPLTFDPRANDSDPDVGDTLAIAAPGATPIETERKGTVARNVDGTLTYTPPAGFAGDDRFGYTIVDTQGATAEGVVDVFVNTPPVAVDDEISIQRDERVTILVLANDTDFEAHALTVAHAGAASANGGALRIVTDEATGFAAAVEYAPVAGFVGVDTFSYEIADAKGGVAAGHVTVHVGNTVDPAAVDAGSFVTRKRKGGGLFHPAAIAALVLLLPFLRRSRSAEQTAIV